MIAPTGEAAVAGWQRFVYATFKGCGLYFSLHMQAWIFDEYTKFAGFSPGIVTGKVRMHVWPPLRAARCACAALLCSPGGCTDCWAAATLPCNPAALFHHL